MDFQHDDVPARFFLTKTIRIISLAPDSPVDNQSPTTHIDTPQDPSSIDGGPPNADPHPPPAEEIVRSQALLQLLSMLRDEYGEMEDDHSGEDEE
jgi:hypothetical protein